MLWNLLPGCSIRQGCLDNHFCLKVTVRVEPAGYWCWCPAKKTVYSHRIASAFTQESKELNGWVFEGKETKLSEKMLWWTSVQSSGLEEITLAISIYSRTTLLMYSYWNSFISVVLLYTTITVCGKWGCLAFFCVCMQTKY